MSNDRRAPRIRLAVGPSVTGFALSAALGAVAVGCCWLATTGVVPAALGLLMALVTVAVVRRPASLAPAALVLLIGAVTVFTGSGIGARTFGLVLALHVMLRLAAVCSYLRWDTRVELAVLRDALLELLPVQVLVQVLTVGAAVVTSAPGSAGPLRWLAVGAALAVALLVLPRSWLTNRD